MKNQFTGTFEVNEKVLVYYCNSWSEGIILTKESKSYPNGTIERFTVELPRLKEGKPIVIPANNFGEYGVRKVN